MDRRTYYARLLDLVAVIVLGLLTFILAMIVIRWAIDFVTWSSLDSGWAQAIGATIGIGVAIWVPYNQSKHADRRQRALERSNKVRLCLSLKDELEVLLETYSMENAREMTREAPDEIFGRLVPIPKERFPIYRALVSRLTELESADLRKKIAVAYQTAQQLIDLIELNNNLLQSHIDLVRQNVITNGAHSVEVDLQHQTLCALRGNLRNTANWARASVSLAIEKLEYTANALSDAP